MGRTDSNELPRREYVRSLVAVGGAAALASCVAELADRPAPSGVDDPESLPVRQHAWNAFLSREDHGNHVTPRHHVLQYLSYRSTGTPSATDREHVETALRTLERAYEWSNEGLLFTIGYSPAYVDRFEDSLPADVDLPEPRSLSSLEDPAFDRTDALLHLASDSPAVLLRVEEALAGERDELNGISVDADLTTVFERVDRRTGFVGEGLPAEKQAGIRGIPNSNPVPEAAPLFMGFRSSFRRNQATEDRVTIENGPFAGGTTQHVSKLRLQLEVWYEQDSHYQRVAKMFSPMHAEEELVGTVGERLTDSALIDDEVSDRTAEDARQFGVVGHAQKVARVREDGTPLLLRRDFDTTDDGEAGLHFLSLQRGIGDFERTREAMNGTDVAGTSAVGARLNNGILQYIFVQRRGNFLLPPRPRRALPDVGADDRQQLPGAGSEFDNLRANEG